MFCMVKKEKIHPAYLSERNSNSEKQFILLMILKKERWHYIAVKILSAKTNNVQTSR